jgi:hypothetical protein
MLEKFKEKLKRKNPTLGTKSEMTITVKNKAGELKAIRKLKNGVEIESKDF